MDRQINVRYRQLRGLVIHYRRRPPDWFEPKWVGSDGYRRSLICSDTVRGKNLIGQKETGVCRWCELWLPPKKRRWCNQGCVRAYAMALGTQVMPNTNTPLLSSKNACCADCGHPGRYHHNGRWVNFSLEVDHIVALSVAHYRGERERKRAHLLDNLQWLCPDCHKVKTASDRRKLANLKAGRPEDWIDPRDTQLAMDLVFADG